jgi:uncharacterized protein (TIGR00369 family)
MIAYVHGAVPSPTPPDDAGDHDRTRTVRWHDPMATARAATTTDGLDFLRSLIEGRFPPPPIAQLMGYTLVDVAPGKATFELQVGEHLYNPIGSVHGGAYGVLLDSAMGCAVQSRLAAGTGYTTVDYGVKLVRPITTDVVSVLCHGEVVHLGRKVATAEGRIVDADGRLYATGTTTCLIL